MIHDRSGIIDLPIKLAVCFLILGLMVPVVMETVENADDDISLYELRREAGYLRDAIQRAYFANETVTLEIDIPSGQSIIVSGDLGYNRMLSLCVDGEQVDTVGLGSACTVGETMELTGNLIVKLTAMVDSDGSYGVKVII